MEYVVKARKVTKQFKEHKAVNEADISIKKGEIFGFVGKNGAGKTTFMKMLCGLTSPTSGEFEIFGATGSRIAEHRRRIGNLIEDPGIYPNMTAKQNLHCKAIAIGVTKKGYEEELLELVGLKNTGKKKVKDFSLGMRQRLGIAMAMLGGPDLLVLDEPINGLDPEGIAEIRNTLIKLKEERGMTIMISSHILEELFKIADTFCFINNGHVIEQLPKEKLIEKSTDYVRIKTDDTAAVSAQLEAVDISSYKVVDKETIYVYERLEDTGIINRELNSNGILVSEITLVQESLEQYFLELTGGMDK